MNSEVLQQLFPPGVIVEVATEADEDEGLLHPAELALMGAMVPARRREFTAGRNAARRALARLGFPAVSLPREGSDRDVAWPAESVGSISHTRGLRAVAGARKADVQSVGLDVEEAGPLGAEIIDAICRAEELVALAGELAPLPSDWPRLLFAMKEAAYKAWYPVTRRMLTFHDMRIDVDLPASSFRAEVLHQPEPGVLIRGRYAWDDGYVAAGAILDRRRA